MKEYLFLFRPGNGNTAPLSPEQSQAQMQKWMEWMGALQQKNQLISAQPLTATGKQVTGRRKTVTEGPFIEGREPVGGYLMCKADDYDAAIEIAKGCPILELDDGKVEVREVQEMKI